jgi:hypothetical protein
VFLCCGGCKSRALAEPQTTLAKVEELKRTASGSPAAVARKDAPPRDTSDRPAGISQEMAQESPSPSTAAQGGSGPADAEISAGLAKLSPADRQLAEAQRFCAVLADSRLGSMGAPVKLMVEGQPVFICCEGCQSDALAKPAETLTKVKQLKERHDPARGK